VGYSGHGSGLNNPAMQNRYGGPIPVGQYTIGRQHDIVIKSGPHAGEKLSGAMRLTPDAYNDMYGRNGFIIHGAHANDHHDSSEGCPIFNKYTRDRIAKSKDTCFVVTP
jgi:hypothetical protein